MGGVWRLTERNWTRYIEDVEAGKPDVGLDSYGVFLGNVTPVTDLSPEDAKTIREADAEDDAWQ
jgi:hypothetical protein